MSLPRRRVSVSSTRSDSPLVFATAPNADSEAWLAEWKAVLAKDIIDSPVVTVDADTSVEDACELLLSKDLGCLAVKIPPNRSPKASPFYGLFDFADVNAFLTLAATRHKISVEALREKPRVQEILDAAGTGKVPAYLVSNLSEKNPLEVLPSDANLVDLLAVFARGAHRAIIQAAPASPSSSQPYSTSAYLGLVSDRALLAWLTLHAERTPSLLRFLSVPLTSLALPSLHLYAAVIAANARDSVLSAMRLMCDEGVGSIAVVDEESGGLLSAVSVTDIGRVIVPAQSNAILGTALRELVAKIKEPDGSTDGADKFPVYSVTPNNTLFYTMQKLLATNAHRVFVTDSDSPPSSTSNFTAPTPNNLCGIVSVVDVLSLFALTANIPDVDPTRMQRHRRASSTSSGESPFAGPGGGSPGPSPRRSNSRSSSSGRTAGARHQRRVGSFDAAGVPAVLKWAERVTE
ncbi:uncharacterized protein BXZ73DRAFT_53489 [Epithele typhae]|uniref:uncharacterized protein n=1 Tax=Epithele typhae TaxID=378194 RepID=UPI0020085400|nr:uncharacterized protein BXZ73DRAFT_53489 [Epithele typhae]KAH9916953.1 hypothetical protein BXZ73DRAFT_53489 [Epithele typhae]